MRFTFPKAAVVLLTLASAAHAAEALISDRNHASEVLRETRNFRIFLPGDYGENTKRYPVIYWFHGYGERHNKPIKDRNYDTGEDYWGDTIGAYVSKHDLIVVKLDGYNPRTPKEEYVRPWNIGPVETERQFPLYFPELVAYIDANYRTIADRNHRATAGLSMGGFMSFWVAGKYPHLVSSASNFMGSSEFFVGTRRLDVEYRHDEMSGNYDGVRTRLVTGTKDFIQFFHRRMNAIWLFTNPGFETHDYEFDHGTPRMAATLDFHMNAFAKPLPKPAAWNHIDVYQFFDVWGWSVASDRRSPGFTALENVSKSGFRCAVREWVPGGSVMPKVKLSISTDRLYPPRSPQTITIVRLRDGKVRRLALKADAEGRLTVDMDGEDQEVGISPGGVLALSSYRVEGEPWATVRRPVKIRARFWNKGAAGLAAQTVRWETPNPSVGIPEAVSKLPAMAAGASAEAQLTIHVFDETREVVRLFAVAGGQKLPINIPMFAPAAPVKDFRVADGKQYRVYQRATGIEDLALGRGNGDGAVNPGETIAVLLPDGEGYRAAELFTNDACVDNSARGSDPWGVYDHVGASSKYSLPAIRSDCAPGHLVRFLARVLLPDKPNHKLRYAEIDLPVVLPPR
ncbi:MAG TPA: alpha/beta hydrolase-fold protein [Bryobacteraceae bacterium]|nr:alpha/beta hydrolase-fold protein [Bryobacteraceae bacterium]